MEETLPGTRRHGDPSTARRLLGARPATPASRPRLRIPRRVGARGRRDAGGAPGADDPAGRGGPGEKGRSCAVRLLGRGFFRIGSESYAEENKTYGLATMQRRHVTLEGKGVIRFDYTSKGGKRRVQAVVDPDVYRVVAALKRRTSGRLLAYK